MTFTEPQKEIIRDICSLEFQVLEKIIAEPYLGKVEDEDDFTIDEILEMHGCTRSDFDESLIDAYHQFQRLHDEPSNLTELGTYEMNIFVQVLHSLEDELWKHKYPNALLSLWNKIFIWQAVNEIKN